MNVRCFKYPDAKSAADACSLHIIGLLEEARSHREFATIALSGGTTPKLLFEQMVAANFDWRRVHLFWVDERGVPPADDLSNYKMAEEFLIAPAHIPAGNVHRIRAELPAPEAASQYVREIQEFFQLKDGAMPQFDVVQLGMGADGHTASLFPGEPLIDDRDRIAAAVYVEKMSQWRITLLPGALLAARHSVFLIAGSDKREAAEAVLEGEFDPKRYPAQVVARRGRDVAWFTDTSI